MNVQEYKEKHNEQKEYFIDSTKMCGKFLQWKRIPQRGDRVMKLR